MAERKSLVEALKPKPEIHRAVEEAFVFGQKQIEPVATQETSAPETAAVKHTATVSRVPFTTRVRTDIGQALKRASLERQLQGVEPSTVQDILESALEPWLKANGYLT